MPCPTVLPMARKVPLDNDDRNVRHGQFKMSSELLKFLNPVNAERKGTGVFSCFIYTYSVYLHHPQTHIYISINYTIIWIARHTTESPRGKTYLGQCGPPSGEHQPAAARRQQEAEVELGGEEEAAGDVCGGAGAGEWNSIYSWRHHL